MIIVASVAAVLIVVIGAITLLGRSRGPSYPDEWDARAQYAVSFIETDKGRPFLHPVFIDFMTEADFVKTVTAPATDVTDDQRKAAAQEVGRLRALGLVQGDIDLLKEESALHGSGTAAYYDPKTKRVKVRGTELSLAVKETLVHELTHAWQDQYYDLTRLPDLPTQQERDAFRTMAEGDAVNSERAWDKTLSDSDRKTLTEQSTKASDTAVAGMKTVPDVLIASFSAPYQFGPAFMRGVAKDGGSAGVDAAFANPPSADRQIMQPWIFLAGNGQPLSVPVPSMAAKSVEQGSLGALFVYLMLAEHIDPHQALAAADAWGGDAYAVTNEAGKVCVKARVDATSTAGTEAVTSAFAAWAQDLPQVHLTPDATGVGVETCDPGPAADLHSTGRSSKTIGFPAARVSLWAQGLAAGDDETKATCFANAFTADLKLEDLGDTAPSDERLDQLRTAARAACP